MPSVAASRIRRAGGVSPLMRDAFSGSIPHQGADAPRSPSFRTDALVELVQRLALDLADALAGQAEALADLLERLRLLVVQAEAHPQHGRLALVHLVEQVEDVVQLV